MGEVYAARDSRLGSMLYPPVQSMRDEALVQDVAAKVRTELQARK
jgi:hypothetical protein